MIFSIFIMDRRSIIIKKILILAMGSLFRLKLKTMDAMDSLILVQSLSHLSLLSLAQAVLVLPTFNYTLAVFVMMH